MELFKYRHFHSVVISEEFFVELRHVFVAQVHILTTASYGHFVALVVRFGENDDNL